MNFFFLWKTFKYYFSYVWWNSYWIYIYIYLVRSLFLWPKKWNVNWFYMKRALQNAYDQIFNLFCTCKLTKCLPNVELQIYLMINKLFISFDSLIMLIIYTYSTWFFPLSLSTHFVQIFFKNKKTPTLVNI